MIKQFIFLIALVLSIAGVQGQVTITLQVPPAGVLMKNQLWNMLLVSGNNSRQLVTVSLSLQDIATNQVVMTATSKPVAISKGATQLKADLLSPIRYDFPSSLFNSDRDPGGMLPAGAFVACYTVTGDHNSTLTENCININVDPLSPPLLNTPFNESVLETNFPQFTWLPPTPRNIFSDLNYEMNLVEVLPGQSSTEAVENNLPVLTSGRLKDQFLNYPASNKKLDTGRLYAWRVIAKNGSQPAAVSEVWTFRIAKNIVKQQQMEMPYYKMFNSPQPGTVPCTGLLKLQYEHLSRAKNILYTITAIHDQLKQVTATDSVAVQPGQNYLSLDLRNKRLERGRTYIVEITDDRGQVWGLKFTYSKPSAKLP